MAKPRSPKQRAREAKRTPAEHIRPADAAPAPAPQAEPAHVPEPADAVTAVEAPAAAVEAPVAPAPGSATDIPAATHEDANRAAHGADHHTPSDDHDADHASTGHGHDEGELGPFDVVMWTFGMVGVMLGVLIWAAFAIATTSI